METGMLFLHLAANAGRCGWINRDKWTGRHHFIMAWCLSLFCLSLNRHSPNHRSLHTMSLEYGRRMDGVMRSGRAGGGLRTNDIRLAY
jgi:hypothetical protein